MFSAPTDPAVHQEAMRQAIRDYIGGRAADGDAPADILADLNSQAMADKAGASDAYWAALDEIVPRAGDDGKPVLADSRADKFEAMADDFVQRRYGGARSPLHRQHVEVNDKTIDALHRTLAEVPEGAAAYKPIGDLTHQERRGLRQWFEANVGSRDERGKALAGELKAIEDREPPKTAPSLFGDDEPNPDHTRWQQERDAKAAEVNQAGLSWSRYAEGMGGPEAALSAVQDLVRSEVAKRFAGHHNRLNPDAPIKVGRQSIRGGIDHLDMTDPEARAERQRKQRELVDDLRERDRGRYASGSVVDKLSEAAEARAAESQAQVDMFGFSQPTEDAEPADAPLKGDQRHSLGHAAERQLAGIMQHVGQNFRPGDKLKIWEPSMDGKHILGQRAIKFIEANKRVALGLGVGTGKTVIGLGSFTHLHAQGKAKKGLFVVPSSVQGQFHGEALRYLDPGKYKWHAQPGASREERLQAMADPDTHFTVVTHQALRDDLLHLGAQAEGIEPSAMADKLDDMTPEGRKAWAGKVMEAHGIKPDFVMADEAHGTLNRKGKENSALANVLDAVGHNADHHILASADPIKNDASEIHSLLQKLDPDRYGDRDAFLRKYGGDTASKKDALRREMTPYLMTGRTDPGVQVTRTERSVPMNDSQEKAVKEIQRHIAAARLGRIKGTPDVAALKALSPGAFEGVPEAQHAEVAKKLQASLGVIQQSAMRSVIDDKGVSSKLDEASKIAAERKGKPGVIFAHTLEVARDLHERLAKEGHRVGLLTGAHSAQERAKIIGDFNPEGGEADAKHDILIMSDAGATGINAQRGKWLMQYDTPVTSMTHAQRQGRIHRLGQKSGVEFIDLVGDHPHEHKARERLRDKYELREVMTDPAAGLDDTGVGAYLSRRQADREKGQGGVF
jgi:superfamily II DNA or RNA helicase